MTTNKTTDFELNYIKKDMFPEIEDSKNKDFNFEYELGKSSKEPLEQPDTPVIDKWSFIIGFIVGIGIWCWYTLFKIIF